MYFLYVFATLLAVGAYGIALPPLNCNATTEHVNGCGNTCERTCSNVLQRVVACPLVCMSPACECNKNYARYNGVCIPKRQCPISSFTCPQNEHVDGCGNLCERRCENNNGLSFPCPMVCAGPECVCDDGYAREGDSCVPVEQCGGQK